MNAKTKTIRGKSKIQKARTTPKTTAPKLPAKKTVRKNKQTAQPQIENILERVSDGFVAFDTQMNYTYVSARGGELLGRKPQELIGKNYWKEHLSKDMISIFFAEITAHPKSIILSTYPPLNRLFLVSISVRYHDNRSAI